MAAIGIGSAVPMLLRGACWAFKHLAISQKEIKENFQVGKQHILLFLALLLTLDMDNAKG